MAGVTEAAPAVGKPERSSAQLPRFPALDGLKAVAVLALIGYDLDSHWARGGHLGATTLFTLFGFLGMASLLNRRAGGRGLSLNRYWSGRIRRILPATLVVLLIAGVFGIVAATAGQRHRLALDGVSSLVSLTNWRMIETHQAYIPANGLLSPMRQFWLLAIAGQVLLGVSLVTVLVLEKLRWSRMRLMVLLVLGTLVSFGCSVALRHSVLQAFYGTETRAAEVLIGCILAVIIFDQKVTVRLAMPGPYRDMVNAGGVFCGLVLAGLWIKLTPKPIIFVGPLIVCALLSAVVITACIVPEGPLVSLLGSRFFRWLGGLAILLYLVHWPIFVWLSPEHVHVHKGLKLIVLRLAATFVAAVVLKWLFDASRGYAGRMAADRSRGQLATMGAVAMLVVAVVLYGITKTGPKANGTVVTAGGATTTTAAAGGPVPTVAFYGDALASTLETAATSYADRTGKFKVVDGVASPTCGIDRDQIIVNAAGASVPISTECNTWDSQWSNTAATTKPDIAVVVTGISEVADHRDPTDPTFTGPLNANYQWHLYLLMQKAVDSLVASGTRVIWLNLPDFPKGNGAPSDANRVAAFNTLLSTLGRKDAGEVTVGDLNSWLAANGAGASEPIASGFAPAAADHVVGDYLAAQIASVWKAAQGGSTTTSSPASSTTFVTPTIPPPPAGVVVPQQGNNNRSGRSGRSSTTTTPGQRSATNRDGQTRTTRTTQGG
jgi:peptidoglycan/LPS O-acetylase OafA/YrhL